MLFTVHAVDAAGVYETADSDADDVTDSDDDMAAAADDDDDNDICDKDNDAASDDIHPAADADNSDDDDDDDVADSSGVDFSAAHQPLRGSFKTAEGITVTIVKGSIIAQKVCLMLSYNYHYAAFLIGCIMSFVFLSIRHEEETKKYQSSVEVECKLATWMGIVIKHILTYETE